MTFSKSLIYIKLTNTLCTLLFSWTVCLPITVVLAMSILKTRQLFHYTEEQNLTSYFFRLTNNEWWAALTGACVCSVMFSQWCNTYGHQKEPQSTTFTTCRSILALSAESLWQKSELHSGGSLAAAAQQGWVSSRCVASPTKTLLQHCKRFLGKRNETCKRALG